MKPLGDGFDEPHEISDIQVAFPANIDGLLPRFEDIPESFRKWDGDDESREWIAFQNRWFYQGIPQDVELSPVAGVKLSAALRHLGAIQGSFEPKWEHKQAAVAWLASRWLAPITLPAVSS